MINILYWRVESPIESSSEKRIVYSFVCVKVSLEKCEKNVSGTVISSQGIRRKP